MILCSKLDQCHSWVILRPVLTYVGHTHALWNQALVLSCCPPINIAIGSRQQQTDMTKAWVLRRKAPNRKAKLRTNLLGRTRVSSFQPHITRSDSQTNRCDWIKCQESGIPYALDKSMISDSFLLCCASSFCLSLFARLETNSLLGMARRERVSLKSNLEAAAGPQWIQWLQTSATVHALSCFVRLGILYRQEDLPFTHFGVTPDIATPPRCDGTLRLSIQKTINCYCSILSYTILIAFHKHVEFYHT